MFKSDIPCKGEGETCSNLYIQNKKKHLCSDCVFKLNHGGKSKQEVYSERSQLKIKINGINIATIKSLHKGEWKNEIDKKRINNFIQDELGKQNQINQDKAEEQAKIDLENESKVKEKKKRKRYKPLSKQSKKQVEIDYNYKLVCQDMDYTTEPVCTGCLRYQGGDIKLSHSHIISRQDCHNIGRPELIYDRDNLTYHCLDFGENTGCHRKWESPKERKSLQDYDQNIEFIKQKAPELLEKYLSK